MSSGYNARSVCFFFSRRGCGDDDDDDFVRRKVPNEPAAVGYEILVRVVVAGFDDLWAVRCRLFEFTFRLGVGLGCYLSLQVVRFFDFMWSQVPNGRSIFAVEGIDNYICN